LRRGVAYRRHIRRHRREQILPRDLGFEALPAPSRTGFLTKESAPQIVVDANNIQILLKKLTASAPTSPAGALAMMTIGIAPPRLHF
jgi:hypothetical protein